MARRELSLPRIDGPRIAGARVLLRVCESVTRAYSVERGVSLPPRMQFDLGAMVSVSCGAASAYAATADLRRESLQEAAVLAHRRATRLRDLMGEGHGLRAQFDGTPDGSPCREAAAGPVVLAVQHEVLDRLRALDAVLARDPRIVDRRASLRLTTASTRLFVDGEPIAHQQAHYVEPGLEASASDGTHVQTRSLGGRYNGLCRQGGIEVFDALVDDDSARRIADESIELLLAPDCPESVCDLLLAPDQMMLQVHESIGHPLELDRILGDERNFAGSSFVTLDMFGRYAYGSPLLDVSFAPDVPGEFASYAFDDEGTPAARVALIRRGILLRPLGGAASAARASALGHVVEPLACARASGWHRPAIDRMANLNVEPGTSRFDELVSAVENGVYMSTNASWSIDDARDKFQFGCEWGRVIRGGRLGHVVRNPNYRGRSADFWRGLVGVGDADTMQVHGTPFCGKGEPGQIVRVGHGSPACLFRGVEVFGGG